MGKRGWHYIKKDVLNLSPFIRKTNDPVAMHFYTNGYAVDDHYVIGIKTWIKVKSTGNSEKIYEREKIEYFWTFW